MRSLRGVLAVAVVLAAGSAPAIGDAEAERSGVVDDVRLRTLEGGTASLVERSASASVLVFFRTAHDRSVEALRAMGECQAAFAGRPVRFVAIVSDRDPSEEVRDSLRTAGAKLPVLLDEGDAVYARLGVRTHPSIFVLDRARRIVAYESYRQVGLCEAVKVQVRRALGELSEGDAAKALAPARSEMPGEDRGGVAVRHVKLGRKLLGTGAIPLAHDNARKSLAIAPSAGAWALEGDAYRAEKDCAKAVAAYESALKLDPANADARSGRKACTP